MKAIIVLVILVGLAASIGAIVVGGNTFEGIVVEKPYDAALNWSHSQHEKADLGWSSEIQNQVFSTGRNGLVLSLKAKDGTPLTGADASVTVSRPATRDYDRQYALHETRQGLYQADLELPLYGHWNIAVAVSKGGRTVVFDEDVYADRQGG